jgi:hypothetical protein
MGGRDVELTEFVSARLDEDEAVARAAIVERQRVRPDLPADMEVAAGDWPAVVMVGGERWLATVEAHRKIVASEVVRAVGQPWDYTDRATFDKIAARLDTPALRALASIWSDHEAYDPAWEA